MSEDRVFAKCAWRLMPFLMLLYLVSYIDRVNVGFAALTMNRDLNFSPEVFGFGAGVFSIGYCGFHLPGTLLVHRFGAKRAVFCILASWGALSAAGAFIEGPISFFVLRFFLGVAEAGFVPGMLLYLTFWFPQSLRARITANFQTAIPFAVVIGGPLSGYILQMNGLAGLRGWQWLFLLEGLPAVLLAFPALALLPNSPAEAGFLSQEEKASIASRLLAEDATEHRSLRQAVKDVRVLALGIALFGDVLALTALLFWMPQIVRDMGFSNLTTGFLVALPFLVSVPVMILWGRSSDMRQERVWHAAIPALTATAGLMLASVPANNTAILAGLFVAAIGSTIVIPQLNNLPGLFLGGTGAAGGIGLYLAIGNSSGFAGPIVVGILKQQTGGYGLALAALAAGPLLSAAIVFLLGHRVTPRVALAPAGAAP
jgi:ACS family tartrate transporter-like MFS transporter